MRTIAITGAGGYIGQRLIENLEKRDWCAGILGIDIVEPKVKSSKLTFKNIDIRDHLLINFLKDHDIDTFIHLAFIVNPMHDEKKMYDINVNGNHNILKICDELKIGHIIAASSGTAYGAWPDNPEPLKEDDPIRLFPSKFSYAHHKGLMEQQCAEYIEKHPDVIFNIVRPSVVYGPNTDNYLSRIFNNMPAVTLPDGRDPNFQYVHEDDLARLFLLLIEKKIPGPFNAAGDGVMKLSEGAALIGKRSINVPYNLLYILFGIFWRLHIKMAEAPPGMIDYMTYPWVLDTTRAKELLGWNPEYSTKDTLRIMLETHGYKLQY